MSGRNIDALFNIWVVTLNSHCDKSPFCNHKESYDTINPLGDMPWVSFKVKFNGDIPDGGKSAWMDAK